MFQASKYMDEFDATHCQPLPHTYFRLPWSVQFSESDESDSPINSAKI